MGGGSEGPRFEGQVIGGFWVIEPMQPAQQGRGMCSHKMVFHPPSTCEIIVATFHGAVDKCFLKSLEGVILRSL